MTLTFSEISQTNRRFEREKLGTHTVREAHCHEQSLKGLRMDKGWGRKPGLVRCSHEHIETWRPHYRPFSRAIPIVNTQHEQILSSTEILGYKPLGKSNNAREGHRIAVTASLSARLPTLSRMNLLPI